MDLSVILPAYEEAANLRMILPVLRQALDSLGGTYEIVVVDTVDARDETEELCAKHGVRCQRRSPTDSFGDAYRSGIRAARGRHIAFMDADGSHPANFITNLYREASDHDIVIASRYIRGGGTENHWILELMSRALNLTYSVVLGIPCRDMSNSLKVYDGDRLRALDLRCDHFDVIEEIMVGFARDGRGLRIKEVPFTFRRREAGVSKRNLFAFVLSYVQTLFRLRLRARSYGPREQNPTPAETHFADESVANNKAA
jgi:dolichol-phosphate mannosyltransferase